MGSTAESTTMETTPATRSRTMKTAAMAPTTSKAGRSPLYAADVLVERSQPATVSASIDAFFCEQKTLGQPGIGDVSPEARITDDIAASLVATRFATQLSHSASAARPEESFHTVGSPSPKTTVCPGGNFCSRQPNACTLISARGVTAMPSR